MVDTSQPNDHTIANPYLDCFNVENKTVVIKQFLRTCAVDDLPNDIPIIARENKWVYWIAINQGWLMILGVILSIILIIYKYREKIYKEIMPKK